MALSIPIICRDAFKNLDSNDLIVTGNGAACIVTFQTAWLKDGQRLFSNSGAASMVTTCQPPLELLLAETGSG